MSHKFQIAIMLTMEWGMLPYGDDIGQPGLSDGQEYENKIFIENEIQFNIS